MDDEGSWLYTILVHNDVVRTTQRPFRQSVTLPAKLATRVRALAKRRRVSANRMIVELVENGLEAQERKQKEFATLAERFRRTEDPEEAKQLGDQLGRMIFG
jgi:hypothetical protein